MALNPQEFRERAQIRESRLTQRPAQNVESFRQQPAKLPKVCNWCIRINNPQPELEALCRGLIPTKAVYVVAGFEHRGARPQQLQREVLDRTGMPAGWTHHAHIYIQMCHQTEFTAFKKLLKLNQQTGFCCEPSNGNVEQNKAYITKGDKLQCKNYRNLPQELDGLQINPYLGFEYGTPTVYVSPHENRVRGEETKKANLLKKLTEYKNSTAFVIADPALYAHYRSTIIDYYAAQLRLKPCERPYIEWHFGLPRCGKTFAGYAATGGKGCLETHCQQGPLEWITGSYQGQTNLFLNEYRKSSKEAFTMLLSIMEGFPADVKIKGGFTPIRSGVVIITCPRPPRALDCEFWGLTSHFEGEYSSKITKRNENGIDITGYEEWEDVDQILERIVESGGKLVGHARRHPIVDGQTDFSKWEYTSVTVLGNGSAQNTDAMDSYLNIIGGDFE